MNPAAISVRNLSKCYRIVHQTGKAYRTLRDDIADHAKRIVTGQWKRRETGEDFWALRDISFDIQPGEIVGIIGRNGAGKSTLLKTLCRITPPTAGDIWMRGRVGSLLEVGTGFHPELTGRENIFLSGAILGMKRREVSGKFDEIVAFAEVEQFLDTPVKRYSSGMYVRLAFAVAAHLETEILLVDEVLAVGDIKFQEKCLNKMSNISATGRTVLFVSHNMTAVAKLCRRGLLLHGGRILSDADVEKSLVNYRNLSNDKTLFASKFGKFIKNAQVSSIEETSSPLAGFLITVEFELSLEEAGLGLDVSIRQNSNPVFFLSSAYYSNILLKSGTQTVRCTIGPLNLASGMYSVDVKLCRPSHEWLEQIDDACEFEIERQVGTFLPLDLKAQRLLGFVIPFQDWKCL